LRRRAKAQLKRSLRKQPPEEAAVLTLLHQRLAGAS